MRMKTHHDKLLSVNSLLLSYNFTYLFERAISLTAYKLETLRGFD